MGLYRRCAACRAVACGTARQGLLERGSSLPGLRLMQLSRRSLPCVTSKQADLSTGASGKQR